MPDPNAPSSTITAWDGGRRTSLGTKRLVALGLLFAAVGAGAVLLVRRPWEKAPEVDPVASQSAAPTPFAPAASEPPAAQSAVTPVVTPSASAETAAKEAEEARKRDEGLRLFQLANARFDVRDWRGAAALYEQTDATWPGDKPKLRAAICWDKLGKTELAASWYEKFLADDPDPTRFTRAEIEGAKRRLEAIRRGAGVARPQASKPATSATTGEPSTTSTSTPIAPPPTTTPSTDPTSGFGDRE
jgi:hypothetical protein